MARTIYKFGLDLTDTQIIQMPKGAKALSVQMQFGNPALWVELDPEADIEDRVVIIHGTGHDLWTAANASNFVGTIQTDGGRLVFHVFLPEAA